MTGYTEEENACLAELEKILDVTEEEKDVEDPRLLFLLEETGRFICEELHTYQVPKYLKNLWIAFTADLYCMYGGQGSPYLQSLTEGDVTVTYRRQQKEELFNFYKKLLWGEKKARW